jgi:FixJ family two-component response regulator
MQPDSSLVHVIDDDETVAAYARTLLAGAGHAVAVYGSGPDFLARWAPRSPQCVLLDLRLPRMSGLELLRRIAEREDSPPVIMMSGYGTTHAAVEAMKLGAQDFLEKPFDPAQLLDAVARAVEHDRRRAAELRERGRAREKLARLTPREREVFELIVLGNSSKAAASTLDVSKKTVDLHRGNLMRKLGAGSVIDLLRLALAADGPQGARSSRLI